MRDGRWVGRLFFGPGRLVYAGMVGTTTEHAHHAHQVLLSPGAPVSMLASSGPPAEGHAFFIPANAPHTIGSHSLEAIIVLIDPDSSEGRALRTIRADPASAASWLAAGEPLHSLEIDLPNSWEDADHVARRVVSALAGPQPVLRVQHPALKRAIRAIAERVERGEAVRLSAVATQARVSSSRLAHLFSEEVGIPMRPYVLWQRLHRAAYSLAAGRTLTEAAHESGFSDGAHFSRITRRMFGISPSTASVVEWVPPPPPERGEARSVT